MDRSARNMTRGLPPQPGTRMSEAAFSFFILAGRSSSPVGAGLDRSETAPTRLWHRQPQPQFWERLLLFTTPSVVLYQPAKPYFASVRCDPV
jgi:hypothetical protein